MTAFAHSSLTRNVLPDQEPVTIAAMRNHLRIDGNYDDPKLHKAIATARDQLERWTDLALITQGWLLTLDEWWGSAGIELPKPPIQSISKIEYESETGLAVLDPSQYVLYPQRRLLAWAPGASAPGLADGLRDRVQINFIAGVGDNSTAVGMQLPSVAEAMFAMAGYLYEHRGDDDADVPLTYVHLAHSVLEDFL